MSWEADAVCRGHEKGELWFSNKSTERIEAARICNDECPVLHECRDHAIRHRQTGVVQGGMIL